MSTGLRAGLARQAATILRAGKRTVAVLRSILHEIFDESAYARFLARHQVVSSPATYAAFQREHEAARLRRPRCC